MSQPPVIVADRLTRRPSKQSSFAVPFAIGLVSGIVLSNVLGVILYVAGVIGLSAAQLAVPGVGGLTMSETEIAARFDRLLGQAAGIDSTADYALAELFAGSTIYLRVMENKNSHPDVIYAASKLWKMQLDFASINERDLTAHVKRFRTEFAETVRLIKTHEPQLARELASDVQTAVFFR